MTTPQKNEQASAFIPILMILLGVALISVGWIVNDPTGEIQNSIGNVIEEIFNPTKTITVENPEQTEKVSNLATATTLVIVVPNDNQPAPPAAPAAPAPVMPVAAPAAPAPVMPVAAPAPPAPPAAPAAPAAVGAAPTAPVVIVTATSAPVIMVTATLNNGLVKEINTQATAAAVAITPAVITTATSANEQGEVNQNVSGHCSEWTNDECEIHPTATPAPTYVPPSPTATTAPSQTPLPTWTPLPPTPTITPTPLPENNSITSIVTLQGAGNHGGTSIIVTNNGGVVVAHTTTTDAGMWTIVGLDKGSYQLAAYSANGSHLPACNTVTVGGNESIAIPQTMLSSGGGFNTDENVNIGAAALLAIKMGLTIPEHMLPILDINKDSLVDKTDADMLIANPKLLACQAW